MIKVLFGLVAFGNVFANAAVLDNVNGVSIYNTPNISITECAKDKNVEPSVSVTNCQTQLDAAVYKLNSSGFTILKVEKCVAGGNTCFNSPSTGSSAGARGLISFIK